MRNVDGQARPEHLQHAIKEGLIPPRPTAAKAGHKGKSGETFTDHKKLAKFYEAAENGEDFCGIFGLFAENRKYLEERIGADEGKSMRPLRFVLFLAMLLRERQCAMHDYERVRWVCGTLLPWRSPFL